MGDRASINIIHQTGPDQTLGLNLYLHNGGSTALFEALARAREALDSLDDPPYFTRYVVGGLIAPLSDTLLGGGLEPYAERSFDAALRFGWDSEHTIVTLDLPGRRVWLAPDDLPANTGTPFAFPLTANGLKAAAAKLDELEEGARV
ncbi:MAG: hypothetical protein LBG60_09905 [Bifidobacteriaceae bacterium]|jgi:hypothetical protein|nr:hypothetical protein [Bifidobacteriaceae bacterium]